MDYTLTGTINSYPGDCQTAVSNLDQLLFPSDTVQWAVNGTWIAGTTATLKGVEVTGLTVGGKTKATSLATAYLTGSAPPTSVANTDCDFTNLAYGSGKLTAQSTNQDVVITYVAKYLTTYPLSDGDGNNKLAFHLTGTLTIPAFQSPVLALFTPSGGKTNAPSSCSAGNGEIAVTLPHEVYANNGITLKWSGATPAWTNLAAGTLVVKLEGIEIYSCQVYTPGKKTPYSSSPVTNYLNGNTGSLSCNCSAGTAVQFDSTNTCYKSPDGVEVRLGVKSLSSLTDEQHVEISYALWFTYQVGTGAKVWWAYDPELEVRRIIDTDKPGSRHKTHKPGIQRLRLSRRRPR